MKSWLLRGLLVFALCLSANPVLSQINAGPGAQQAERAMQLFESLISDRPKEQWAERARQAVEQGKKYYDKGINRSAYDAWVEALRIYDQELKDPLSVAAVQTHLGELYSVHGNISGGIERFRVAYRLYSEAKSSEVIKVAWKAIHLEVSLRNLDEARKWLDVMTPPWLDQNQLTPQQKLQQIVAEFAIVSLTRDTEEAIRLRDSKLFEWIVMYNTGDVELPLEEGYWLAKYMADAFNKPVMRQIALKTAEQSCDYGCNLAWIGSEWLSSSYIAEKLGRYDEALYAAIRAADAIRPIWDPLLTFRVHAQLGHLSELSEAWLDAQKNYLIALKGLERIRAEVPGEVARVRFFGHHADVYSRLIKVVLHLSEKNLKPRKSLKLKLRPDFKSEMFPGHLQRYYDMIGRRNWGLKYYSTFELSEMQKARALLDIWEKDYSEPFNESQRLKNILRGMAVQPSLRHISSKLARIADLLPESSPFVPCEHTAEVLSMLRSAAEDDSLDPEPRLILWMIATIIAPQIDPIVSEDIGARARESLGLLRGENSFQLVLGRELKESQPTTMALNHAEDLQSAILAYHVAEDVTLLWVFLPSGTNRALGPYRIEMSEHELAQAVQQARNMLLKNIPEEKKALREELARLGSLLLGIPLGIGKADKDKLQDIDRLNIIPDGPLHKLPFQALMVPRNLNGTKEFLVQRFEISYAPAVRLLFPDFNRFRINGTLDLVRFLSQTYVPLAVNRLLVLAAGDLPCKDIKTGHPLPPLRFAAAEKVLIEDLWESDVIALKPSEAHKTRLIELLSDADIAHFATHAVVDSDDPLSSYLLLQPKGLAETDLLLTAREILELRGRMGPRFVVLSACSTMGKHVVRGEGLMGLNWAFLAAGVPTVIATQWFLHDATAPEVMNLFYNELRSQQTPATALAKAQRELIRNGNYSIHQWAAYIVVGWQGKLPESLEEPAKISAAKNAVTLSEEDSAESHNYLGLVFSSISKGDEASPAFEEAIRQFEVAIEKKPDWFEPYLHLAVVLREKDFKRSNALYEKAVDLSLNQAGRPQEAIEILKRVGATPGYIHAVVAQRLMQQGDLVYAKSLLKEAIDLIPDLPDAHMLLARVLSLEGKIEQAQQEYQRALKIDPQNANAHYNLGVLYLTEVNDIEAGLKEFEQAVAADPNHFMAQRNLIQAYILTGQHDRARAQLLKAEQLELDIPAFREELERFKKVLNIP